MRHGTDLERRQLSAKRRCSSSTTRPGGLVALERERRLEVGDERRAEREVGLRARDDLVERAAREREAPVLPRTQPLGAGGRSSQELADAFFVVASLIYLLDPSGASLLPSSSISELSTGSGRCGSRSFPTGCRARRRSCGSSRRGRRSGRGSPGRRRTGSASASRTANASSISSRSRSRASSASGSAAGCSRPRRCDRVEAQPPRELRDPRSERRVVAQGVEAGVDTGEDLLEDVLRVLLAQPEARVCRSRTRSARSARRARSRRPCSPARQRWTSSASDSAESWLTSRSPDGGEGALCRLGCRLLARSRPAQGRRRPRGRRG